MVREVSARLVLRMHLRTPCGREKERGYGRRGVEDELLFGGGQCGVQAENHPAAGGAGELRGSEEREIRSPARSRAC